MLPATNQKRKNRSDRGLWSMQSGEKKGFLMTLPLRVTQYWPPEKEWHCS